eukprot:197781_1
MPRASKKPTQKEEGQRRIAIINEKVCKPKKCNLECKRHCPVNRTGKKCIEVKKTDKTAWISEELCIGCNICVKKCPFDAITIINLPGNLENQTTHRYGPNSFKLHRLPIPRPRQVLGLVGTNGIGKSTALKILCGKLKLNLGKFAEPPDWEAILKHFRGNELQNYFTRILEEDIKSVCKPQYVDHIPRFLKGKGTVREILKKKSGKSNFDYVVDCLDLEVILDREIEVLSGGELQRFAIAVVALQKADVYMFDEPSSYLDIRQRMMAARVIRSLLDENGTLEKPNYVVVVEHDLSILDYLSDFICCLYGRQGAYGVVSRPSGVREGINMFLEGFIPSENLRFRNEALTFKVSQNVHQEQLDRHHNYSYPAMTRTQGGFKLHVKKGSFTESEIIVMLGQNGCGKTTFIKMLAGFAKPDKDCGEIPKLNVSYKPQKISPNFKGTVRDLLHKRIRAKYQHPQFVAQVMKPMLVDQVIDRTVTTLSGGELQRVALVLCLGAAADIYLIDEPSAYLDSEQRIVAAKVIKRFILAGKKTAFVVEHDFIMATYLADRVIVYDGKPAIECTANAPQGLLVGMNKFLKDLGITFRRDPTNHRPRINKEGSQKDQEQKASGNYFLMDVDDDDNDDE